MNGLNLNLVKVNDPVEAGRVLFGVDFLDTEPVLQVRPWVQVVGVELGLEVRHLPDGDTSKRAKF